MEVTKSILFIFIILIISCTKHDYNSDFVEYLKAERNLKARVSEKQGLSDSIIVLQQRYHIDPEKELSKLENNPDAWPRLIKELRIEE